MGLSEVGIIWSETLPFFHSLNDSCALSADVGWPCIQPRMDHPEELLPELKKQLEPLEDARNQVEGIHTYVIKTLKERGCSNWHVLLGGSLWFMLHVRVCSDKMQFFTDQIL